MNGKIKIDLEKREDTYGKSYFIGKIKAPITIDCEKGIALLVFISEEGAEQLQICNLDTPSNSKIKQPIKLYKSLK